MRGSAPQPVVRLGSWRVRPAAARGRRRRVAPARRWPGRHRYRSVEDPPTRRAPVVGNGAKINDRRLAKPTASTDGVGSRAQCRVSGRLARHFPAQLPSPCGSSASPSRKARPRRSFGGRDRTRSPPARGGPAPSAARRAAPGGRPNRLRSSVSCRAACQRRQERAVSRTIGSSSWSSASISSGSAQSTAGQALAGKAPAARSVARAGAFIRGSPRKRG